MRAARYLIGLMLVAVAAQAEDEVHRYYPLQPGARLTYLTTSTLAENVALAWELSYLRGSALADGGEQLQVRYYAMRGAGGKAALRHERLVREPRGVFTPRGAGAQTDGYGPWPLIPAVDRLERIDTVWRYEGQRHLPFAMLILDLTSPSDTPVATQGRYHVLNRQQLETRLGTFAGAVQVTGVERVEVTLRPGETLPLLLRCRRHYIAGLGLAREEIAFLDYPRLGQLTTELVSYTGIKPETAPEPVAPGTTRTAEATG